MLFRSGLPDGMRSLWISGSWMLFPDLRCGMFQYLLQEKHNTMYHLDLANAYYENYVTNEVLPLFNGHNWYDLMTMIAGFVQKNKGYFRRIISNGENDMFSGFLFDYGCNFYSSVCRKNRNCEEISQEDDLAIRFISSGGVYTIKKWVLNDCEIPLEKVVKCIVDLSPDIYSEYLE